MKSLRPSAARLLAAIGLALLGGAEPASAFDFSISPTSVSLSGKRPSALLTVKSQGTEAVSIQMTAYEWSEGPDGAAKLEPTEDLLVFPPIATLAPGGTRAIRIGAMVPRGEGEKSYRIYIEEMPNEDSKPKPGEVRVLSRFGIPVFVAPALKGKPEVRLESVGVAGGKVRLSIGNAGNVHARLESVVIRALDASGSALFTREIKGWYLLAAGLRRYEVPLDAAACRAATSVAVEITSETGTVSGSTKDPPGGC
jgi:fimbrial chaperone protein